MVKALRVSAVIFSVFVAVFAIAESVRGLMADDPPGADGRIAIAVLQDLSATWSVDQTINGVSAPLRTMLSKPKGQHVLRSLRRFGRLLEAQDVTRKATGTQAGQPANATITFKGRFEHGTADVEVDLRKIDGVMKMAGFKFTNGRFTTRDLRA